MPSELSPRLAAVVDALPLTPRARVLEIGCGPGAAARAVAARLVSGHVLAVDRSARAVAQAVAGSAREIASGRTSVRCVVAEDFVREPGEGSFGLVFAVRVGALDGRHPEAGRRVLQRVAAALAPGGRLFVDGGDLLREIAVRPRPPTEPDGTLGAPGG
ncbi:SAM-dependent methyltransferase [Streptomyces sp. M92]|uniref:SAM-dependent methyltransferase n=1 Tax=Streptomyces sp. M92 TaxID=2944250 RepID=UPI00234BBD77|nr:class I SAM-dependent methyltransferase [Streptomyces sp. M92]WCN04162.1 class I SAM-dependent methyltransferase [Streptomyces sp. M92]